MVTLQRVESESDWAVFIDFAWKVYQGHPHWVPPLRIAVRNLLNVRTNPFFKHAFMYPLLAYRGGQCVGRAVGVIDENHNQFHEEKTAFFGFFEAIDDQQVVNVLLSEIAKWAKSKGMSLLRGPMSPSTNHECGLLVEGFTHPPAVLMTYNPPYYGTLLERWGLVKCKDLFAFEIDGSRVKFSDRIIAHAEKLRRGNIVTFRAINMSKFDDEIETILEIYNDAWERNWGFVPMNPEEFRHMAKDLKSVLDPELLLIAEVRGEPAAFALTLPDINQALRGVKDGRLFPTGLLKILWNTKGPGRKRTMNRCRVLTLGIKKAYRDYGIGPLFYAEYYKRGPALGYPVGEASWILEDNRPMNKALRLMKAERTKTYRIYERTLS